MNILPVSQSSAPSAPLRAQELRPRVGGWISLYSGKRWYFQDPHPGDVDLRDIAHGLALTSRFGGQCREFYSVAQHCVLMAEEAKARQYSLGTQLWALLHDAPEAYLGDVVRPLKELLGTQYKVLEHLTEGVILASLDFVPLPAHRWLVAELDDVLLVTEHRDLTALCEPLPGVTADPLGKAIRPWSWKEAEGVWLLTSAVLRAEITAERELHPEGAEG